MVRSKAADHDKEPGDEAEAVPSLKMKMPLSSLKIKNGSKRRVLWIIQRKWERKP